MATEAKEGEVAPAVCTGLFGNFAGLGAGTGDALELGLGLVPWGEGLGVFEAGLWVGGWLVELGLLFVEFELFEF